MKNCLQHILDQGYGLYSINDAISIKYCNDEMYLVVTPIPALNEDPIYMELRSRTPGQIRDEIMSHMNTILAIYRDIFFEDVSRI